MTKATWAIVACAALLWAEAAVAKFTPTPQQRCDSARITAWKVYTSCIDVVVAKDAKGAVAFDEIAAFAKCRHAYFRKWTAFQSNASLASSTCRPGGGERFIDNLDGTVTDNLTTLVWEKKDNLDGTQNFADPHDADNTYTWSTGSNSENGTVFTQFLTDPTTGLNVTGFAGSNGWRLPTLAELQSIMRDFARTGTGKGPRCHCGLSPCIDGMFGPTSSVNSWSATGDAVPDYAWEAGFIDGSAGADGKSGDDSVRAVRGSL